MIDLVKEMWLRKALGKGGKTISGVPPLIFKSDGSALKNYRIDGAAGGVGDLVTDGEHTGSYHIPVIMNGLNLLSPPAESRTVEQDGLIFSASTDGTYSVRSTTAQGAAQGSYINFDLASPIVIPEAISSGGHGVIQLNNTRAPANSIAIRFYNAAGTRVGVLYANVANRIWNNYTFGGETVTAIGIYVAAGTVADVTFRPALYLDIAEQIDFVDYQEPVVTNLYLDAPLDDGESISLADTGIPIRTINGTNILMVGTTVQPSGVEIKGKIKEIQQQTVQATSLQSLNLSRSALMGSEPLDFDFEGGDAYDDI